MLLPLLVLAAACDRTTAVTAPRDNVALAYALTPVAPSLALGTGAPFAAPLGLTGCWGGEGNATDAVLGNNGTILGAVSFAPGRFGQAFSFDSLGGDVLMAPSPSLDVMRGDGITLAAWFFPKGPAFGSVPGSGPILEFDNGAQIWVHSRTSMYPATSFFADMAESDLQHDWHIEEAPGVITQNAWNHGVATYSKTSGNITIYVNGVQVGQTHVGLINPKTSTPFHIGSREPGSFAPNRYTWNGLIDEAQLYNRELTPAEVLQLATASASLCTTPAQLNLLTQPTGAESGVPFAIQPSVDIRDASGIRVSFATTAVTVSIATGAGTLSGTTTVNAVNGVATFTNLQITGVSGSTTLRFAAAGLPALTSGAIPVMVHQLGVVSLPVTVTSGKVLTPPPTVEVRDAAGVRIPDATNAVTVSIGSGGGTLSGTLTVNAVAGVATFSNLIITGSGSSTLSFTIAGAGVVSGNVVPLGAAVVVAPALTYAWSGFFGDMDAAPKLNRAKAGKEVDVEFSLGGDQGTTIFAAKFPASRALSCKDLSTLGALVSLVPSTTGDDNHWSDGDQQSNDDHGDHTTAATTYSVTFDKHSKHYTLQWQTDKSFDDSCRALVLTFMDGTTHSVYFNFSK